MARRETAARCKADGLYWLRNHTCTYDEHALKKGLSPNRPFPDLGYMDLAWKALLTSKYLFFPKSREMMTSWLVAGYMTHTAQFNAHTLALIQTQNEKKVQKLLSYSKCLYDKQDLWMRQMHPLKAGALDSTHIAQTKMSQEWASEASVVGVPGGADQIRAYHPTIIVFDEAAHLPEMRAAYDTALPVADQIICISSAGPGFFAEMVDDSIIDCSHEDELMERFGVARGVPTS